MDILNKLVEKVKEGTKYYHVVGEGDLDDFLRKVSLHRASLGLETSMTTDCSTNQVSSK